MSLALGLQASAVSSALRPFGPVESARATRHHVLVDPKDLREALGAARRELKLDHFVQLATIDVGDAFELRYILTGSHRALVSVRTRLPRAAPHVASVHDLLPPAGLYERQVHDLFGVVFDGHPGLSRLVLAEDWPEGVHPLRKDFLVEPATRPGAKGGA